MTSEAGGTSAMSDQLGLVERLRDNDSLSYALSPMAFLRRVAILRAEAADEIERLRAALDARRDWQPPPKMPDWPEA